MTKRCTKCGEIKPVKEFHKNKSRKDGLRNLCKSCVAAYQTVYRATASGKALRQISNLRYAQSPKGKAAMKAYSQSDHGKSVASVWRHSENGRAYLHTHAVRRRADPKSKVRLSARSAVSNATKTGELPKANTLRCQRCGHPASQWHHPNGYHPSHWLDVVPLCGRCHYTAHQEMDVIEEAT